MMSALPKDHISVGEYLRGEETSEERHEYFDGHVYAMAGGTSRHNYAAGYFYRKIADRLESGPCQAFSHDFKVRVEFQQSDLFYYPDVFVACDPDDNHRLFREKPKFWLEVMSEDENKDRVEQYLVARRIESVEEFVIVSADPEKPEVSIFRKSVGWEPPIILSEGDAYFESVDLKVSVDQLYEKLASITMVD